MGKDTSSFETTLEMFSVLLSIFLTNESKNIAYDRPLCPSQFNTVVEKVKSVSMETETGGAVTWEGNFAQHTWRPEHADVDSVFICNGVRDAILKSPLYLPDILKWTQLHLISDCSFAVMF